MFKINTSIRKPNIQYDTLNQANEDPNNSFINITNITEFENIKNDLDLDYIDGAITIEYVDRLIMGFSLWDLVDQLWAYLINLIEEVIKQ